MNKENAEAALRSIIRKGCEDNGVNFEDLELTDNTNLLKIGVYDSLGFLQLIASIEDTLDIELDLMEEDPEEFTQFGRMVDIIVRNK